MQLGANEGDKEMALLIARAELFAGADELPALMEAMRGRKPIEATIDGKVSPLYVTQIVEERWHGDKRWRAECHNIQVTGV